jgi:HSP20 family protein
VDVIEEEDSFTILVELPGVDPDAVKVTVKGHMLTIRGDRPRAHLPVPCRCVILERLHGPFERQVLLPAAADSTRMQAEFKDGVLLIHIVKSGNP